MATPGSGVETPVKKKFSPSQIATTAVLLILAAIIAWRVLLPGADQTPAAPTIDLDPNRIAVVPFTNRTGDASLDNLAALTADRLTQGLADLKEIEVAPASVVAATSAGVDPSQLAREVAAGTRSGMVLTGVWDAVGDGLELQATLEDASLNTVVRAFDPIPVTRDAPQEAVATLRDWTLMAVQDHLHPILAWGAGDRFPVYEAYVSFRRFFEEFRGANAAAARNFFQAAQLDPEFARPRIHAGCMWTPGLMVSLHDMVLSFYQPVHEMELTARQQRLVEMIDARIAGNWSLAYRQSRDEFELDPTDSWQQYQLMRNAAADNRPALVIDLFQALSLDPLAPSVFRFGLTNHALEAFHLTGQHEKELALAREYLASGAAETSGASVRADELTALAALGRADDIDTILTEVLLEPDNTRSDSSEMRAVVHELRAHGFREEAQALAERTVSLFESDAGPSPGPRCDPCEAYSLMAARRYADARRIFEIQLAEKPEVRDWIAQLGVCAAHLGDRSTALEMDTRLVELGDNIGPTGVPYGARGSTELNRAGIAAQLGDRDRAIHLIQQAVAAGFREYMWIHADPNLEPLWDDPEFQEILRPKG
jgi:tetratricopeptide (TPR) repeat protein/TolB-like protein